jgi:hypothetical protein
MSVTVPFSIVGSYPDIEAEGPQKHKKSKKERDRKKRDREMTDRSDSERLD